MNERLRKENQELISENKRLNTKIEQMKRVMLEFDHHQIEFMVEDQVKIYNKRNFRILWTKSEKKTLI